MQINTAVSALAPEEIEKLVSFPIESQMAGLPQMVELRSLSKFGLSQVTLVFHDDVDLYRTRQLITERLQAVLDELPPGLTIFILSDNSELWKFYPESLNSQKLGSFICNGQTATFSMSVDRLGFAWVMFSNGDIYKVDVTDPTNCTDPGYTPNQGGANLFGMGFVSNSAVDQCDSLFGNTFSGFGFSEGPGQGTFLNMNPDTLLVSKLGPTTFNGAEVTGTGDGRVFIFGGVNPAKIVEVDRTNGAYLDVFPVTGIETTQGFAFAFFAGDFYIFTESDQLNDAVSKVTHVDYDDSDMNGQKDITKVVPQAPIRIVGAGVSTCAPFLPQ